MGALEAPESVNKNVRENEWIARVRRRDLDMHMLGEEDKRGATSSLKPSTFGSTGSSSCGPSSPRLAGWGCSTSPWECRHSFGWEAT